MEKYLFIVRDSDGNALLSWHFDIEDDTNLLEAALAFKSSVDNIALISGEPFSHSCEVWYKKDHHLMELVCTVY